MLQIEYSRKDNYRDFFECFLFVFYSNGKKNDKKTENIFSFGK